MRSQYKILFIGFFTIAFIDTLGSIASKQLHFNYAVLFPISTLVYASVGFFITNIKGSKAGIISAALIGLFDATVGWKISMLLNPYTGDVKNDPNLAEWLITLIIVTFFAALMGWAGVGLSKIYKQRSKHNSN